jgi:hypothetical protein
MPNDGEVTIRSALFGEPVHVDRDSPHVERILRLPAGRHEVRFVSGVPPRYPSSAAGDRMFVVEDFRLDPVQPSNGQSLPLLGSARE